MAEAGINQYVVFSFFQYDFDPSAVPRDFKQRLRYTGDHLQSQPLNVGNILTQRRQDAKLLCFFLCAFAALREESIFQPRFTPNFNDTPIAHDYGLTPQIHLLINTYLYPKNRYSF